MIFHQTAKYFFIIIFTLSCLSFGAVLVVFKPVFSLYGATYSLSVMNTFFRIKDYQHLPKAWGMGVYSNVFRDKDRLQINLKQKNRNLLDQYIIDRMGGVERGYLKGEIRYKGDSSKIKMRIKGDRDIHFRNPNKVSYRIKTRKGGTVDGMSKFSIHHPGARNYMEEYLFILASKELGIISPKYEFIDVLINDMPYGVYALEEYPTKNLLERSGRREGPIYRFDEITGDFSVELISKVKEVSSKGVETRINDLGRDALESFREGRRTVDETFDSHLMGRYFAVASLFGASHGLVEKSIRLYFNPISLKFEPIPFDGHPDVKVGILVSSALGSGYAEDWTNSSAADWFYLFWRNSGNDEFVRSYLDALSMLSTDQWVSHFLDKHELAIAKALAAIYSDFPGKDYTWNYGPAPYFWETQLLNERAALIHKRFDVELELFQAESLGKVTMVNKSRLPQFFNGTNCTSGEEFSILVPPAHSNSGSALFLDDDLCRPYSGYNGSYYPIKDYQIGTYATKKLQEFPAYIKEGIYFFKSENQLLASNQFANELDITSIKCGSEELLSKPVVIASQQIRMFGEHRSYFKVPLVEVSPSIEKCARLFVSTSSNKSYSGSLIEYPSASGSHVIEGVQMTPILASDKFLVSNGIVSPMDKVTVLNEAVKIPAGLLFTIPPGYSIDLAKGSFIYSESPVKIGRDEGEAVRVFSSDSTGRGLVVYSYKTSYIENAQFDNLGAIASRDWPVSGSITFTKGTVNLSNVEIIKSHSEDALNIVDSSITIKNLVVVDSFSDGFDCDFCRGLISDSSTTRTGNDGFDFSGSSIMMRNILVSSAGDKGISVGEQSDITIKNSEFNEAAICVASKDSSITRLFAVKLINCEIDLASYQKKKEFGGGVIEYENTLISGVIEVDLVSKVSEIK
jgi:hypothetical protein